MIMIQAFPGHPSRAGSVSPGCPVCPCPGCYAPSRSAPPGGGTPPGARFVPGYRCHNNGNREQIAGHSTQTRHLGHPARGPRPAERYLAVWSEPDPASRRAAIADLWASDGAEFVEGTRFQGHEELQTRIAHAYQEFVASGRYAVTVADDVTRHGDIVTFTIQLTAADGEVAWAARVFLLLGKDGLIRQDYQLTVKPLAA